ncbi:MAG: protein-export chaperone SecB [Pseudomonadota bacterium]
MAKKTTPKNTTSKKNTKTTTKAQADQTAGQIPVLPVAVNAQFIKDLSFETSGPLQSMGKERTAPSINLNIEVSANKLQETQYEVSLHIIANASKSETETEKVFVMDLTYSGVFTLTGIEDQNIPPILLIECPRLLFPFARNIVADVTRDGGFPPLALSPVDFAAIYRQQVQQMQQQAAQG